VRPDDAFVLVSWSTVIAVPFVRFLFEPHALVVPVKPGKSRQIVAKRNDGSGQTDEMAILMLVA
jgi:hypothetical protein